MRRIAKYCKEHLKQKLQDDPQSSRHPLPYLISRSEDEEYETYCPVCEHIENAASPLAAERGNE